MHMTSTCMLGSTHILFACIRTGPVLKVVFLVVLLKKFLFNCSNIYTLIYIYLHACIHDIQNFTACWSLGCIRERQWCKCNCVTCNQWQIPFCNWTGSIFECSQGWMWIENLQSLQKFVLQIFKVESNCHTVIHQNCI